MLNIMEVMLLIRGGKEYSELKGTTLIGTIQKEDEKDEDSLLEVVYD